MLDVGDDGVVEGEKEDGTEDCGDDEVPLEALDVAGRCFGCGGCGGLLGVDGVNSRNRGALRSVVRCISGWFIDVEEGG